MSAAPLVDLRGEPCGMPVARVEKFIDGASGGRAFEVLADHEQTVDQLRLLAARRGWTCTAARDGADWRLEFRPS
jgi:TusA-related sulfurtransferase